MGFRVLLVEPDPGLTDDIRRAFGPVGFSVSAVETGERAVERCQGEHPDVILLAAELPDMSGFSVCNRLKRADSAIPLLLYTAEATDSAIEAHRATRTHADDYLKKPFELPELLGRVAALLHGDPAPSAAPRPAAPQDGKGEAKVPPGPDQEPPPRLQRVSSGRVAARGLASAMAAAARPPAEPAAPRPVPPAVPPAPAPEAAAAPRPGPPPVPPPPPVPGRAPPVPAPASPAPGVQAVGRVRLESPRADPTDVLAEWPRDPAPPKGTPDEKLDYFRERLRARDAFLAKVREALARQKAQLAELGGERDGLEAALSEERARTEDLSHRLQEAGQDAAAVAAQLAEVRKSLEESEATRGSLSEVLNETIQQHETTDQAWSVRVAAAEEARGRLEAELGDTRDGHARAVASLEADRADERARLEGARAEAETQAQAALSRLEEERQAEREGSAARLETAQARVAEVTGERDALEAERARLAAEVAERERTLAELEARAAEERSAARTQADGLTARVEEAEGRLALTAGERDEALARAATLEAELARAGENRGKLEEMLRQARAETRAHEEKSIAAEHTVHAKVAELGAAQNRIGDLTRALEEGRASVEGTRGELARLEAGRADGERRAAEAGAARDQLAREIEAARRAAEEERERGRRLDTEVQRLSKLEPLAEETTRLRKEVASLREMVQQRTQAAEAASRAAQAAAAERAKFEERLAVEAGRMQGGMTRLEADLASARRRVTEVEAERNTRAGELARTRAELERHQAEATRLSAAVEARGRSATAEAGEQEKRHQAEVARLKAAMVELEKHLEARARSDMAAKKRIQELEKAAAVPRPAAADPAEIARLKDGLAKLKDEVEELRGENDFLNGEVARYVQKNKDLTGQLASLKEA